MPPTFFEKNKIPDEPFGKKKNKNNCFHPRTQEPNENQGTFQLLQDLYGGLLEVSC